MHNDGSRRIVTSDCIIVFRITSIYTMMVNGVEWDVLTRDANVEMRWCARVVATHMGAAGIPSKR